MGLYAKLCNHCLILAPHQVMLLLIFSLACSALRSAVVRKMWVSAAVHPFCQHWFVRAGIGILVLVG